MFTPDSRGGIVDLRVSILPVMKHAAAVKDCLLGEPRHVQIGVHGSMSAGKCMRPWRVANFADYITPRARLSHDEEAGRESRAKIPSRRTSR